MFYCILLSSIVFYCFLLYSFVFYCIILYVFYCILLYCVVSDRAVVMDYVCMYVCIYLCVCMYVCVYLCMYVHVKRGQKGPVCMYRTNLSCAWLAGWLAQGQGITTREPVTRLAGWLAAFGMAGWLRLRKAREAQRGP